MPAGTGPSYSAPASSTDAGASVVTSTVVATRSGPARDRDNDYDSSGKSRYDADDEAFLHFGRPASASDARVLRALVKRYYAAAALGDGAQACSMLYLQLYESVPEDYGENAGPSALRGKTCAVVMSKLFKLHRGELVRGVPTLHIDAVRVQGNRGLILLNYRGTAQHDLFAHYELSAWKIDSMLDKAFH